MLFCDVNAARPGLKLSELEGCGKRHATTVKRTSYCWCEDSDYPVPSKGCGKQNTITKTKKYNGDEYKGYYYAFNLKAMTNPDSCMCEEPCKKHHAHTDIGTDYNPGSCICESSKSPTSGCGTYEPTDLSSKMFQSRTAANVSITWNWPATQSL